MKYNVTLSLDDIIVTDVEAKDRDEAVRLAIEFVKDNPEEAFGTALMNVDSCHPCIEEGQELVPFELADDDGVPMTVSIGNAEYYGFYSEYRIDLESEMPEGMEVYEFCGDKAPKELVNGRVEDRFLGSFLYLGGLGLKDGERLAISPNGELREGQFDYSFDGDDIFCKASQKS